MHEMALAEGIIEVVEQAARAHGATAVRAVRLELGALASVEREALTFCFDAVTRGGPAQGARLEFVEVAGQAWCMPCGATVALARLGDPCPACGSYQLQVTAGEDMRIKDIEVA